MSLRVAVLAILINSDNKTVGARLNINGKVLDVTNAQLLERKDELILDNAIIDSNGFVRAKHGSLHRMVIKEKVNIIEHKEMQDVKKLLSINPITVYHGSKEKCFTHTYGIGSTNNDYGRGFYTTPYADLGREWALGSYTKGDKGYLHKYILDTTDLNILDLTKLDSLHWVAELLTYRKINRQDNIFVTEDMNKFLAKYKLDTSCYDIIIGYRADDSYFTYAEDFVENLLAIETLETALRRGSLGIQVFIKSKKAFSKLKEMGEPELVPSKYRVRFEKRRRAAIEQYKQDKMNMVNVKDKRRIKDFI